MILEARADPPAYLLHQLLVAHHLNGRSRPAHADADHRPQLEQLTDYVREGDTVVCPSMDRLARNLDDLRKMVLGFTERGAHVRFEAVSMCASKRRTSPSPERILRCRNCC